MSKRLGGGRMCALVNIVHFRICSWDQNEL